MDAEQRWQAIARDLETLRLQMASKVREIDTALSDLQIMLQRQLERTRLQEMDAWESYQQSLKERGL